MTRFMAGQTAEDRGRIRLALQKRIVEVSTLVHFDFASEQVYWSDRAIGFTDRSGQFWQGVGQVVQISQASGGTENLATFMTYTLSLNVDLLVEGAAGFVPDILGRDSEYLGRTASLLMQIFDDEGPIGVPITFDTGLMYSPKLSADARVLTLSINAENPLLNKRRPRHGDLTDKAQRARFPNDKGLEYVPNAATEAKDWLNS